MAISKLPTLDSRLADSPARPCIARLVGVSLVFGDSTRALDNFSLAFAALSYLVALLAYSLTVGALALLASAGMSAAAYKMKRIMS